MPLRYVVVVLVVLIVLSGGSFMAQWGEAYRPDYLPPTSWLLASIPRVLAQTLPAAALSGIFLLFLILVRRPGKRLLSFGLSLATASGLLFFGLLGVHELDRGIRSPEVSREYLLPRHIHMMSSGAVYIGAKEGDGLRNTVIRPAESADGSGPFLRLLPQAALDPDAQAIISPALSRQVPIEPENPFFEPMFEPPPFLAGLFSDISAVNAHLHELIRSSTLDFAVSAFALALFALGCLGFASLSRWPLVNAVLCLVLFRGLFFVYRIVTSGLTRELTVLVIHEEQLRLLPAVVFATMGLLILPLAFRKVPATNA